MMSSYERGLINDEKRISSSSENTGSLTVAVEGNIGSGKSTFLNYCSNRPDIIVHPEPIEKWRSVQGENLLVTIIRIRSTFLRTIPISRLTHGLRSTTIHSAGGCLFSCKSAWRFWTYIIGRPGSRWKSSRDRYWVPGSFPYPFSIHHSNKTISSSRQELLSGAHEIRRSDDWN